MTSQSRATSAYGADDLGGSRAYSPRTLLRLLAYVRPYRLLLSLSVVGMLIYVAASVSIPWIVERATNSVVTAPDLARLRSIVLLFLLVMLVNFAAGYFHLRLLARVGQRVVLDLRTRFFAHLQGLSISFFDRHEVGRIMSRGQNDIEQLEEFLSIVVLSLGDLLTLVGIVVAMLLMRWQLAAIAMAVIPLLCVVLFFWQPVAWRAFMRVRGAIAVVNASLQENISGIRVIQSLNRQEENMGRFDDLNRDHLDARIHATRLAAMLMPVIEILTAASLALVVIFGGAMVLRDELEVGVLVAFALYILRFFEPVRRLTMQYTEVQRAVTSASRVFALLDIQPEVQDRPGAGKLPQMRGEIRFENVGFRYVEGVEVLHNIDLHIRPGEHVALVGATGSGKTTLASLLMRLYDVTEGRITVDGNDIRDVQRSSLVRHMSMVLQEPFLFSGSIADNIRYAHTEVPDDEMERVAGLVGAREFISHLPRDYDTQVEERGQNLSPGQRQLIALARALVADPRIVILDEATASVDSYTERRIQRALERLLEGRTAIIIAHRLSTVRDADRIVVLDSGRIVEEGRHEELLARNGVYAGLYRALSVEGG